MFLLVGTSIKIMNMFKCLRTTCTSGSAIVKSCDDFLVGMAQGWCRPGSRGWKSPRMSPAPVTSPKENHQERAERTSWLHGHILRNIYWFCWKIFWEFTFPEFGPTSGTEPHSSLIQADWVVLLLAVAVSHCHLDIADMQVLWPKTRLPRRSNLRPAKPKGTTAGGLNIDGQSTYLYVHLMLEYIWKYQQLYRLIMVDFGQGSPTCIAVRRQAFLFSLLWNGSHWPRKLPASRHLRWLSNAILTPKAWLCRSADTPILSVRAAVAVQSDCYEL